MGGSCLTVVGARRKLFSSCLLLLALSVQRTLCIDCEGAPPQFTEEPTGMQVVFERDSDGNNVSLTLPCRAMGAPPLNTAWFRDGMELGAEFMDENGTLTVENITEGEFASTQGVVYHCTVTNCFGTIRSREATVIYAFFGGFVDSDGSIIIEPINVTVNVTTVDMGIDDDNVALACNISDAQPPPEIEWYGDDTLLVNGANIRQLNNGQFLLLENLGDPGAPSLSTRYFCQVVNVRMFETVRSLITYQLQEITLGGGDLIVYKYLENVTVRAGEVALFSVVAAGQEISYTFQGGNIQSNGPLGTVGPDDTDPTTPGTLLSDGTVDIACLIRYGDPLTQLRPTAILTVIVEVEITDSPNDRLDELVGLVEEIIFTCTVSGLPTPDVEWYFEGNLVTGDDVVIVEGNVLNISRPGMSNTGMYQCFASNEANVEQRSWALRIREPMSPTESVEDVLGLNPQAERRPDGEVALIAPAESVVTLVVQVNADPCPDVTWLRNGEEIPMTNETVGFNFTDTCETVFGPFNFSLIITNFTAEFVARYNATFRNFVGEMTTEAVFITTPVAASVTNLDHPECLLEGEEVVLRCENEGFPLPTVSFALGTEVVMETNFTRPGVPDSNSLTLVSVREEDAGVYTCTADNGQGEDSMITPQLEFCTRPMVTALTVPTETPTEGVDFTLTCMVSGTPVPDIQWQRRLGGENGELENLTSAGRIAILDGNNALSSQLEVRSIAQGDTGIYICRAFHMQFSITGFDMQGLLIEVSEESGDSVLSTTEIIAIAAGGGGGLLLLVVVILLLLCVWTCARRTREGEYVVPGSKGGPYNNQDFTDGRGNVDRESDEEDVGEPEAFNPQYESLPALRPPQPPGYKPTPSYPHGAPLAGDDIEMTKVPPPDTDSTHFAEFMGTPYKQDNGGYRPSMDDFLSEDAQFV